MLHIIFQSLTKQLHNQFLICPPSAAITCSIRPLKLSTAARNFFCGILAQALTKDTFKDYIVVCGERQGSVSNMDQTL